MALAEEALHGPGGRLVALYYQEESCVIVGAAEVPELEGGIGPSWAVLAEYLTELGGEEDLDVDQASLCSEGHGPFETLEFGPQGPAADDYLVWRLLRSCRRIRAR